MIRRPIHRPIHWAALAPLALLGACTAGTAYRPPEAPLPPAWSAANALTRPDGAEWWRGFGDPALDRLETRAMAGSPDLDAALARLDQARAAAGYAAAERLPAAALEGSLARARQSTTAGLGQLTRYIPTFDRTQDEARAGVSASWDLDFAGGLRREAEAARADAGAVGAGVAAARLALAAELADTYFGYRGAETQLATMEARRAALADRRAIMAARLRAGEAPRSALDPLDAALAEIDGAIQLHRAALAVAGNRINSLLGAPTGSPLPELEAPELEARAPIPAGADPAAGVPGDVLRRRPDVVAAEARLRAAHARIGAALAEYWPKFSLQGALGFDSNDLGRFGSGASNFAQGLFGLRWRLFDFGRVDAAVKAARGTEREALANYRAAVLRAGEDVESAFSTLAAHRANLAARIDGQAAQSRSLAAARAAFAAGEISRDRLRESELALLDAEDAVTAARVDLARAVLACHRALGG
jgi:NodT family efflux transporter outer membrane factor (OMF) lipoprotein